MHLVPMYIGVYSNNHAARGVYYINTSMTSTKISIKQTTMRNINQQSNNTNTRSLLHLLCNKQAIKPPPSPSPSPSPSLSQNPQLLVAGARLETPTEELMQSPWPGGWNCCSCAWLNSDVRKARSTLNMHACVNVCLARSLVCLLFQLACLLC